jgi:hypothetical protein
MVKAEEQMNMARPRVLMFAFTSIEKDARVLRHIEALAHDYEVLTIGYGTKPVPSSEHYEIPSDLHYLPLTASGVLSLLLRQHQRALVNTPSIKEAVKLVTDIQFDVLFLNDVQTLGLIDHVPDGTPIIIDMHEFAPREMEDDWRFRLLLQRYYTWLCVTYLPRANLVLTVSDGLKNGYEQLCGVTSMVVRNICAYHELVPRIPTSEGIRLVHSGLAVRGRQLEKMIYAAADLPSISLDLYLVQAPRQARYFRKLNRIAEKTHNVHVVDPVPPSEIPQVLNSYDVGLLMIHPSNFSLKYGLPNKLFDYIQARIMTISGPSPDIASVVNDYKLGIVLKTFEVLDLREVLMSLDLASIINFKNNASLASVELTQESEGAYLQTLVQEMIENLHKI